MILLLSWCDSAPNLVTQSEPWGVRYWACKHLLLSPPPSHPPSWSVSLTNGIKKAYRSSNIRQLTLAVLEIILLWFRSFLSRTIFVASCQCSTRNLLPRLKFNFKTCHCRVRRGQKNTNPHRRHSSLVQFISDCSCNMDTSCLVKLFL
jgi:hypothetical protein